MQNLKTASKAIILTSLLAVFAGASGSAAAIDPDTGTKWEKEHPRRAQVNGRLAKQNVRIREQVKDGEMSRQEAAALHQEHREIRQQERAMAAENNGHITKAQQRELNKQENALSKQIGK